MPRNVIRGLLVFALAGVLVAPAPLAVAAAARAEDAAAVEPSSFLVALSTWLLDALGSVVGYSAVEGADDNEGDEPSVPSAPTAIDSGNGEADADGGPYIDPNG